MDCPIHPVVKQGLSPGNGPLVRIGDFVNVACEIQLPPGEDGER
jgi:hypothetical protein